MFAFGRVVLPGDMPLSVKVGRTAVVWGESLIGTIGGGNSIGYGQNPNDGRKSSSTPGASLKETVLPLGQINATLALPGNTSSLSAYYAPEWRPDRVPAGGTYMGFSDGLGGAPYLSTVMAPPTAVPISNSAPVEGKKGDFGIQFKTRPEWLDGTFGIAYRQFDEKAPWYAVPDFTTTPLPGAFLAARSVYGRDVKILGVTFNRTIADISVGAELNYRKNAALNSYFDTNFGTGVSATDGARGNTVHALVNGVLSLPKTPIWDTNFLAAEVSYNRLQKVTGNANYYYASGAGYAGVCDIPGIDKKAAGCSDRQWFGLGISLTPTIYQVMPSVDMDYPIFVGLQKGNSPLNGGGNDGFTTISAGVRFVVASTGGSIHKISLNYLAFKNSHKAFTNPVNAALGRTVGGAPYFDRDQLQFTYETGF